MTAKVSYLRLLIRKRGDGSNGHARLVCLLGITLDLVQRIVAGRHGLALVRASASCRRIALRNSVRRAFRRQPGLLGGFEEDQA